MLICQIKIRRVNFSIFFYIVSFIPIAFSCFVQYVRWVEEEILGFPDFVVDCTDLFRANRIC
jgi:hypothetical protein